MTALVFSSAVGSMLQLTPDILDFFHNVRSFLFFLMKLQVLRKGLNFQTNPKESQTTLKGSHTHFDCSQFLATQKRLSAITHAFIF